MQAGDALLTDTEQPILLLGLVGFDTADERRIRDAIATAPSRHIAWCVTLPASADAWLVNGSCTEVVEGGDRPIAFSEPVASTGFDPIARFSLESAFTIHEILARFSFWLRTRASQLCLAAQLLEREAELEPAAVYHVSASGRLLAVVDRRGDVGVLRSASPFDFAQAVWRPRPTAAGYIPETFERTSLSMLMWQYAVRSRRDLLPERYRISTIHYRRPPKLEHQRLVSDPQLRLLRELAGGSRRFTDLQERTGSPAAQLAHDLAALYLVGSITTNPKRARNAGHSDWPSRPARAQGTNQRPLVSKDTTPAPIRREPSAA